MAVGGGKTRTVYVCSECGLEALKWAGRCPECQAWNTFSERTARAATPAMGRARPSANGTPTAAPVRISDLSGEEYPRLVVGLSEFDRVLGGGIVPGSLVLIGGDPGIGKCVTANTRVLDPDTGAFEPIVAWQTGDHRVLALHPDTHSLEPRSVGAFLDQGVQPVVDLRTRLGRSVRCTATHPVLTPEGWRAVGDLQAGDRIASPRSLPYFGDETLHDHEVRLIAYALSDGSVGPAVSVTAALPEVAADLAEIAHRFGVLLRTYPKAGSRASQYRFVQSWSERADARRSVATALRAVQHATGISWAAWARSAGVSYSILRAWRDAKGVPASADLARLATAAGVPVDRLAPHDRDRGDRQPLIRRTLDRHGLRDVRAATKFVPAAIFRLPKAQLQMFLKVLFSCDGSVYVNGNGQAGVSYSTISRRLAEDVQHLLLRFGFVTRLRTKTTTVQSRGYTSYEIQLLGTPEVRRFVEEIGIWGRDEAKARLAALGEPARPSTRVDTIPTGPVFWQGVGAAVGSESLVSLSARAGVTIRSRRQDRPLTRQTVHALALATSSAYLHKLTAPDVYWDEVESVTPAGAKPVFDLSVPGHASFVAQDLILHNSTLVAQVAAQVATGAASVLYVSGEESAHQLKLRARRLGVHGEGIYLLTETNLTDALDHAARLQPELLIIDSIQTVFAPELQNAPGSVAQLRECTLRLMQWSKSNATPTFIIGHVTKEGEIAGPRLLEHIVDAVLYLEGERFSSYRLLRGVKNRFGAVSEVGVFEMLGNGLACVENPSEVFLAEREEGAIGSMIVPAMEGSRPVLLEVQALASPSAIPSPRRTASGIEFTRLLLLTAVLTKRAGLRLSDQDVIVNVVGGMKVNEPAADLGVALAIASSYRDARMPGDLIAFGEVGLSGELRSVGHIAQRLAEAEKLGFRTAILPRSVLRRGAPATSMTLLPADTLREAIDMVCIADAAE
jgi:DNA repair protein RadA/Sms